MCGIYFMYKGNSKLVNAIDDTLTYNFDSEKVRKGYLYKPVNYTTLVNRGPDETKIIDTYDYFAAFYRLAIMGVDNGMQPFISGTPELDNEIIMLCNGEIYNYQELIIKYNLTTHTNSDVECILELYKKVGIDRCIRELSGEFAVCIYDKGKQVVHFARDRFGRKPLYMACVNIGDMPSFSQFEIASLYKALDLPNKSIVYPGTICTVDLSRPGKEVLTVQEYNRFMFCPDTLNPLSRTTDISRDFTTCENEKLYNLLVQAVKRRVTQSERPIGFLLSGGFDSSTVLSMALAMDIVKKPHVFTIGFDENASDIKAAETMVQFLREKYSHDCIQWHKVILNVEEGHKVIPEVIYALETYDTTTIRASVPMWLISKYIRDNTNVKVVISGEGSDELFGGYMYFKYAPNTQAMRSEICNLLNNLHYYDVLRADKTTSYFGLEVRTPFLDDDFVKAVLTTEQFQASNTVTKKLIRDIIKDLDLLPDSILHGKKEAFSDAVGHQWKDSIVPYATTLPDINILSDYAPHILADTPETKWYQSIFSNMFPYSWHLLPCLWLPNQTWVETGTEPSARALAAYDD